MFTYTKLHDRFSSILVLSILIFFINLLLKSIFLGSVPPVLTNDETYYATEAQAILANGTDVTGTWRPWNLVPAHPLYSELTGLTYSLGFVLFPHDTQIATKVVPVLFGSLLPVLLGLILLKLFSRKIFFLSAALMATFNPWIFQFSRMGFDSFASVFFYFLGIVCILYLKGWKVLLALIPFSLGFFQYQGHKPILVPLVFVTVMYSFLSQKEPSVKSKKAKSFSQRSLQLLPLFLVVIACCLLTAAYAIRLPHSTAGNRVSEFAINSQALGEFVNTNRRLSFHNPILMVFENKFTVLVTIFAQRFAKSFDLNWFFLHGNDSVDTFSVTHFGFLYVTDAFLVLVGFVSVWAKKKWWLQASFISLIVIFGTIPNVLKNELLWLTFRGSFTLIGLLLFAAIGMSAILISRYTILKIAIILLYGVFLISFLFHYFFQYPLLSTKDLFFYQRVVANYIQRQPEQQFLVFGDKFLFDAILAYNQLITKTSIPGISQRNDDGGYQVKNVQLLTRCLDKNWVATQSGKILIVDARTPICPSEGQVQVATAAGFLYRVSISSVVDSGDVFRIYNDKLCDTSNIRKYIDVTHNVFAIEKLSDQEFCESFFKLQIDAKN